MDEHNDETCETCGRPLEDSVDFKDLKTKVKNLTDERDKLKTQVLDRAITDAGYDPNQGVVRRLAAEFTGDMTADAFRSFAEGEGLAPAAREPEQPTGNADQLRRLQDQEDALRGASTNPQPEPDLQTRIREAEAAGDVRTSMALKRQQRDQKVA